MLDLEAYARKLSEDLFSARGAADTFGKSMVAAQSLSVPLRVRLAIASDAPELHAVRWELLRTPDGAPISTSERIVFSRYLASGDWQVVPLRLRGSLRALVVIADPSDLVNYELPPIDVAGEFARVQSALVGATVVRLARHATVTAIIDHLREGFDVLYIVAHGTMHSGEAIVWLENDRGGAARIRGADLVIQIAELQQRPRLCVLVSCQSAGTGEPEKVASALGPGLARAGVAAVVAMQSNFSMATARVVIPRFFEELMHDGQVDRALAVARAMVRDARDWWVPVLFMRPNSGRLWLVDA